jgi:enoyl-CoA hydratase/carnithine racemase
MPPTFLLEANALINRIEDFPKPSVAAISGHCIAGGLELAMGCDLRVASDTARIGDHHMRIGVIGGGGATTRLPRIVGIAKAKELIYTGETLSGEEACKIGLVNHVYPVDRYLDGAIELAKKIVPMSPATVMWTKVSLNASLDVDKHESLRFSDWCTSFLGLAGPRPDWKERRIGR